jgi:signal transduction histidine kinase
MSVLLLTSFTCSSSEERILDEYEALGPLVVSQPEKALTSIVELKKSNLQLTALQRVKLIRHEVVANTYLNHHQLALKLVENIKEIASLERDKFLWWEYYSTKAIVYWHMDSIEDSLEANLKAYDVVKSIDKLRSYQAITEGNIGYAFIKLGFDKQAVPYLESALEIALTDSNIITLATSYNNLGEAYLGVKNYSKSLELLNKSLAIRLEQKLTFHSSYSYQNLGRLYLEQSKYQQAEVAFKMAINIRNQAGFIKGLLVSKLALAEVYIATNKIDLATIEVEAVIISAIKQQNDSSLLKAYHLQRTIFVIKNDYQKAYQATLNYDKTSERVVSHKTSTKLARYLNTSEAISKDLNILALEKNAEIQNIQINNERQKAKIIIIAGFFIVLVLAIFLWSVKKSKRIISKSNTELSLTLIQLKEAQDKLIKSGQMSALARLISRMAHQVNTPLGIAVTGVSHIHEKVESFEQLINEGRVKKSEINSLIEDLNKGCQLSVTSMDKVADLMSQFKTISESLEIEIQQEFEVFDLISKHAEVILMSIKKDKPIINISGSKEVILGYSEALSKVFSQLITNSIDHAFENTLAPKIDIEISKVDDHIEINYQDNGKGIDSAVVNDVFEPFYTTTMGHKSLGIGLSIVYNLVVQLMQGSIQCKANQDKGIMFCIRLPVAVKVV